MTQEEYSLAIAEFAARGGVVEVIKARKAPKRYMRVKNNGARVKYDPTFLKVAARAV